MASASNSNPKLLFFLQSTFFILIFFVPLRLNINNHEKMTVNGKAVSTDGYYKFDGDLYNGNKISVKWERTLRVHRLNGKVGFSLGPVTLCADAEKSGDIKKPVTVSDRPEYEILTPEKGEIIRVNVKTDDGSLVLTDYQSCGKGSGSDGIITVWLDDAKAQG